MNKSLLKAWWPNNVKDAIPFGLSLLLLNVLYTIIKMCHITYISKKEMSEELAIESKKIVEPIRTMDEIKQELQYIHRKQNEFLEKESRLLEEIDRMRVAQSENPYRPRVQYHIPVATHTHPAESEGEGNILETETLKKMRI